MASETQPNPTGPKPQRITVVLRRSLSNRRENRSHTCKLIQGEIPEIWVSGMKWSKFKFFCFPINSLDLLSAF